ncbi:MAG: hypothetical protein M0Z91_12315 [Actinomycetota bacterium]|nr:hypothetical protein [Actinomycetota bacterium]
MTTDAVGQGLHGKAQVGDFGGEAREGVRVVAAASMLFVMAARSRSSITTSL